VDAEKKKKILKVETGNAEIYYMFVDKLREVSTSFSEHVEAVSIHAGIN
jgi:hypothetical protein